MLRRVLMKKTAVLAAFILITSPVLFSCATEVAKAPEVTKGTFSLSASNSQLARYPMSGFAYKKWDMPTQQWDWWAKNAEPIVRGIINKMPDGYVLEVRGHADSRGPENPEGSKPGNIYISTERAKTVYDALERAGVKSSKMTVRGVGSSEPIPGIDPKSGPQRRVTFSIVRS